MLSIMSIIIEARIHDLIRKRDEAIQKKDYERAWILNLKIDKNVSRLINCSYCRI